VTGEGFSNSATLTEHLAIDPRKQNSGRRLIEVDPPRRWKTAEQTAFLAVKALNQDRPLPARRQ
jgi:hypothetical protein